jgi:hypothetical protein
LFTANLPSLPSACILSFEINRISRHESFLASILPEAEPVDNSVDTRAAPVAERAALG